MAPGLSGGFLLENPKVSSFSYVRYPGNGSTVNYTFSFPYISRDHIKVRLNGAPTTNFTFLNNNTITLGVAPASGVVIEIRRETPKDTPIVDFTDGSVLLERDLDLLTIYNQYVAQETDDDLADSIRVDSLGVWQAQDRRIADLADPVNPKDVVNKRWAETGMTSQLAQATSQATAAAGSASAAATSATNAAASAGSASTSAGNAASSATAAGNSATAAAGSATSASNSATTATTQAGIATTQAGIATTQATSASASANSASTSAGSAQTSASSASSSATAAGNSATNASNSATAAATSASQAATSASSAAGSATTATGAASTATSQATIATTQASNAAASATSAGNSATAAAGSATAAANSASAASLSESNAAASAVSAASSASSAAALLDNFDDRYLGPKASAPTVDNDGNALIQGALYFDTTTGKMRVFTSSGWIDASSASVATLAQFQFNATGGQTTFSGAAAVGGTLTYTVGAVLVSLNGVLLESGSEFTASNGTSIVLSQGAAAGDELNVYAFGNFLVADTYSRSEADAKFVPNTGLSNITAPAGQGAGIEFAANGNTPGGAGASLFVGQGSTGSGFVYQRANQELRFGTNNAERMRIAPGGALGFGGENYGSSGQVLTSNGSGSPPSWQTISTTPTTDQVLAATSGASVGAVGTYAWLAQSAGTTTAITAGTTYAGSGLRYFGHRSSSLADETAIAAAGVGATPSGTWRAMGSAPSTLSILRHTLFLRIS